MYVRLEEVSARRMYVCSRLLGRKVLVLKEEEAVLPHDGAVSQVRRQQVHQFR